MFKVKNTIGGFTPFSSVPPLKVTFRGITNPLEMNTPEE